MQKSRKYKARATTLIVIVVISMFWYLFPSIQNLGFISSNEVDEFLYNRLDDYQKQRDEVAGLANIFTTALTNPDNLTESDRQIYVTYERMFFSGWDAAWSYSYAGHFDSDRYKIWNSWFIDEVSRRPEFAWTENKKHFSDGFVRYIDSLIEKDIIQARGCRDQFNESDSSQSADLVNSRNTCDNDVNESLH